MIYHPVILTNRPVAMQQIADAARIGIPIPCNGCYFACHTGFVSTG